MKCFTAWQHNYFARVYLTEFGKTITLTTQQIFC